MFKQTVDLIIKVRSMQVKEVETEKGKFKILETKGTIQPNNFMVTVSKLINVGKDVHPFIQGKIEEFETLVEKFNAQDEEESMYVRSRFKPRPDKQDKKKLVQFDKISTDVLEDGREFTKVNAWVEELETEKNKDGEDVIVFTFQDGKSKKVPLAEVNASIEVTMIVIGYNPETGRLELTSGDQYPTELVAYASPNAKGAPKVGQGYSFLMSFEKGKRISAADVAEEDFSWGEEKELNTKGSFEPDKIVVVKVGSAKGYILEGLSGGNGGDPMDDLLKGLM
jgi:hypothetical protein